MARWSHANRGKLPIELREVEEEIKFIKIRKYAIYFSINLKIKIMFKEAKLPYARYHNVLR